MDIPLSGGAAVAAEPLSVDYRAFRSAAVKSTGHGAQVQKAAAAEVTMRCAAGATSRGCPACSCTERDAVAHLLQTPEPLQLQGITMCCCCPHQVRGD